MSKEFPYDLAHINTAEARQAVRNLCASPDFFERARELYQALKSLRRTSDLLTLETHVLAPVRTWMQRMRLAHEEPLPSPKVFERWFEDTLSALQGTEVRQENLRFALHALQHTTLPHRGEGYISDCVARELTALIIRLVWHHVIITTVPTPGETIELARPTDADARLMAANSVMLRLARLLQLYEQDEEYSTDSLQRRINESKDVAERFALTLLLQHPGLQPVWRERKLRSEIAEWLYDSLLTGDHERDVSRIKDGLEEIPHIAMSMHIGLCAGIATGYFDPDTLHDEVEIARTNRGNDVVAHLRVG